MARETRSVSKPADAKKATPVVAKKIEKTKAEKKKPIKPIKKEPAAAQKAKAPAKGKQKPTLKGPLKATKTMINVAKQGHEYEERMKKLDEKKKMEEEAAAADATAAAPAKEQSTPKKAHKKSEDAPQKKGQAASRSRSPIKEEKKAQGAPKKAAAGKKQKKDQDASAAAAAPAAPAAAPASDASALQAPTPKKDEAKPTPSQQEEEKQDSAAPTLQAPLARTSSKIGLKGGPTAGLIDVVFCCDTTGSMGSYLQQTKQTVKTIVNNIGKKCQGQDISVQFGFVAYRDHPPQESTYVTQMQDLVDKDEILQYIQTLSASGGGDGPEAVMDGLMVSAKDIKWRNTQKFPTLRYIFHICDAPPHGTLYGDGSSSWKDGCPCGITIEQISHVVNIHEIHYRLIKASSYQLEQMGAIFQEKFTNYEETTLSNAQELDVQISDMIIRELCADMDYDLNVK